MQPYGAPGSIRGLYILSSMTERPPNSSLELLFMSISVMYLVPTLAEAAMKSHASALVAGCKPKSILHLSSLIVWCELECNVYFSIIVHKLFGVLYDKKLNKLKLLFELFIIKVINS